MHAKIFGLLIAGISSSAAAETINTKYCGAFQSPPLECQDVTRSSVVKRICIDKQRDIMVLSLKGVYYCKCNLGQKFDEFKNANSLGNYFNDELYGKFRCIGIDSRFPKLGQPAQSEK